MEISAEKTKLMTNNTSGINTEMKVNRQKLEIVTSFKYLGSGVSGEGSKPKMLSKIAQTTATLTRLKLVWNDRSISFSSKIRLMPLPCYICLPVSLWIMDPHSRASKKNTSHGNEVLQQDVMHLVQRPYYQRGSLCQDPADSRTTRRPDYRKEAQTAVVWSCLPFIRSGQNNLVRHSDREKKTKQTEKR